MGSSRLYSASSRSFNARDRSGSFVPGGVGADLRMHGRIAESPIEDGSGHVRVPQALRKLALTKWIDVEQTVGELRIGSVSGYGSRNAGPPGSRPGYAIGPTDPQRSIRAAHNDPSVCVSQTRRRLRVRNWWLRQPVGRAPGPVPDLAATGPVDDR